LFSCKIHLITDSNYMQLLLTNMIYKKEYHTTGRIKTASYVIFSQTTLQRYLVQHCVINSEYCACYFCQHCVVVNQRCHRIASFLRLVLTKISGALFTIIYAMLY